MLPTSPVTCQPERFLLLSRKVSPSTPSEPREAVAMPLPLLVFLHGIGRNNLSVGGDYQIRHIWNPCKAIALPHMPKCSMGFGSDTTTRLTIGSFIVDGYSTTKLQVQPTDNSFFLFSASPKTGFALRNVSKVISMTAMGCRSATSNGEFAFPQPYAAHLEATLRHLIFV
ncbi:uncharacterized protein BCR38DRAFT_426847, partial [Pseudomassariella vexata]